MYSIASWRRNIASRQRTHEEGSQHMVRGSGEGISLGRDGGNASRSLGVAAQLQGTATPGFGSFASLTAPAARSLGFKSRIDLSWAALEL